MNAVNMKSFDMSEKSKKTLESMIVKADNAGTNNNTVSSKKKAAKNSASVTFSPKVRETVIANENGNSTNESDDSGELDEKTIQANLAKLGGKKGKLLFY